MLSGCVCFTLRRILQLSRRTIHCTPWVNLLALFLGIRFPGNVSFGTSNGEYRYRADCLQRDWRQKFFLCSLVNLLNRSCRYLVEGGNPFDKAMAVAQLEVSSIVPTILIDQADHHADGYLR